MMMNKNKAGKPVPPKAPKYSLLRLFLWLAGDESWIIEHEDCATTRQLHGAIGATVLFTGALGGMAGGYAFAKAFHSNTAAVCFGIFWGALILNLDRYLVMSIKKRRNGNPLVQFGMAIPRLVIAVLMSVSIAKPLELKIFENDLKATRASQHRARMKDAREKITTEYSEIPELEGKREKIGTVIKEKEAEREAYYKEAIGEAEGKVGSGVAGFGPIYARKSDQLRKIETELAELRSKRAKELSEIDTRLNHLRAERDDRLAEVESASRETDGLLSDIAALGEMAAKDQNVRYANWLLVLLIIAVDTAPVFVKLLAYRCAYDFVSQSIEEEVRIRYEGDYGHFEPANECPVFER